MMKTYSFLFALIYILSASHIFGQKEDYQWPMGYSVSGVDLGYGMSIIDFNNGKVELEQARPTPYIIDDSGSFYCNAQGKLNVITNGCVVLNNDLAIIENGDSLNPGFIYNNYCNKTYPTFDASLMFKLSSVDSLLFIVHKDVAISNQSIVSKHLRYSKINMLKGNPKVAEKNIILRDEVISPARIEAIKSTNGKGWWVIESNQLQSDYFYTYYLGMDTIFGPIKQQIGPIKNHEDMDGTQLNFSPDGKYFALVSEIHGLMMFDFNRANGKLSNYRNYKIPNAITDSTEVDGLAFSPNSRFAYVSNIREVYQVDLNELDTSQAVYHLGTIPRVWDDYGWPVQVGDLQLGPDCRIYISPVGGANYLHVIHHPNRKGLACELEYKALALPTRVHHNFPKFPYHRLDTEYEICDSSIAWLSTSIPIYETNDVNLSVFPNPNTGIFKVLSSKKGVINIFDLQGKLIHRENIEREVSLSINKPGLYILQFQNEKGLVLINKKLIVFSK